MNSKIAVLQQFVIHHLKLDKTMHSTSYPSILRPVKKEPGLNGNLPFSEFFFFHCHHAESSSGAHTASYPLGTMYLRGVLPNSAQGNFTLLNILEIA
jgi:hypothetical protein